MEELCTRHVGCTPEIIMAGDFTVKAGWTLGMRQLKEYELVYFPAGTETRYRVNENLYVLDEPCFILTRPFENHSYQFDSAQPTRHLFVHFTLDSQGENNRVWSILNAEAASLIAINQNPLLPGLLKHILNLASTQPVRWKERCNLLLCTLLTELDAAADTSSDGGMESRLPLQISKALQYIDHHLHLPITVAEIARQTGWTHEHFTRMFVQALGISPQSSVTHRRIEKACQLLIQSDSSIKQIAFAVGFQDEHYFSRCFSRIKGTTASDYRKTFSDPRAQHLVPPEEYLAAYPMNRYFIFPKE